MIKKQGLCKFMEEKDDLNAKDGQLNKLDRLLRGSIYKLTNNFFPKFMKNLFLLAVGSEYKLRLLVA